MASRVREVVWAESAHDALDDVITYIAQDSRQAAVQVLEAAIEAAANLGTLSERGRVVPEMNDPADATKLRESLRTARSDVRDNIATRLSNALVYVAFVSSASSRARGGAIQAILEQLATISEKFVGDWRPPSGSPLSGAVRLITIRRGRFGGPLFDVEGVGAIGDPTLERVQAKWSKPYKADSPIELLAYYELQPVLPVELWVDALRDFVESNWSTAPFRRVWVFDVGSQTIPFVAGRPA